jgi:hypothetical protein
LTLPIEAARGLWRERVVVVLGLDVVLVVVDLVVLDGVDLDVDDDAVLLLVVVLRVVVDLVERVERGLRT